ncbi:helix-turn-helix domain-containing protein [Chryseobacterium sp. A321]
MTTQNNRTRALIKQYREQFNFTQKEIATLSGLTQSAYSAIEIGKGNIDFDKVHTIAKAYGLTIWDFINPSNKIPKIIELPESTKIIAILKKDKVNSSGRTNLNLPQQIMKIINSNKLSDQFTSSDIWKMLPVEIKDSIKSTRVTDTISRQAFSAVIFFTGRKRGKEMLYQKK